MNNTTPAINELAVNIIRNTAKMRDMALDDCRARDLVALTHHIESLAEQIKGLSDAR